MTSLHICFVIPHWSNDIYVWNESLLIFIIGQVATCVIAESTWEGLLECMLHTSRGHGPGARGPGSSPHFHSPPLALTPRAVRFRSRCLISLPLTGRSGDHISRLSPQYPCHRRPQEVPALGCEAGLFTTWRAPWTEGTGSLWWLICQGMCSCCRWLWLTVTPWLSQKHETVSFKSVLMSTPF